MLKIMREDSDLITRSVSPKKRRQFLKSAGTVLIGLCLFGLGWAWGSGRLQIQNYSAVDTNKDLPAKLDLSSVDTIYTSLRNNFDGDLDVTKLLDGIKSGLANATGDPYTEYFNPEGAQEFNNTLDGAFEGIGAELGKNAEDNIVIVAPLSGYPAERAGIRSGDVIARVNDEDTRNWTISEAVSKIRGEKGTDVKLTVLRGGEVKEITITRDKITIDSVKSEVKDGVGIMTISRFGDDTVDLARKAAEDFKSKGVKGVVLDLRGNPGGYLGAAVKLSSLWLDDGDVVLTERRDNVVIDTYRASGNSILKGVKTVVLIDEGSASASEITAGALRDNGVATILGQKSYGKGSVQQPINLKDGGLLKVTIARWFTPNGKNIDREGIEPDQKVEITAEDIEAKHDSQLEAALNQFK